MCQLPRGSWAWDMPTEASIGSDWSLECASSVIRGLPASCFFLGCLVGGLVLATLTDSSLCLKNMLLLSCLPMSLAGLFTAASTNIWMYSAFRFVGGFGRATVGTCALVLSTELVGKRRRGQVGILSFLFFTFGFLSLPAIAYFSLYTDSYVSSNFSNKIFSMSSSKSQISKELILMAEVGKRDHGYSNNIGDIKELEEELGEIFFSTDTCFSESQYDCDLPPKYDEYPDDEYEICELSTVEGVHVAIEETRTTTLPKENASEGSRLPVNVVNVMDIPALEIKFSQEQVEEYANYCNPVEEPNIQQGPSFAFAIMAHAFFQLATSNQ